MVESGAEVASIEVVSVVVVVIEEVSEEEEEEIVEDLDLERWTRGVTTDMTAETALTNISFV